MDQPGQSAAGKPPHRTLEKPLAMLVAIRRTARKYLFDPEDWTEYYQGLVLYLLGAMKFGNLDRIPEAPAPLPKQVAFWGAAVAGNLTKGSLSSRQNSEATVEEETGMTKKKANKRIMLRGIKNSKIAVAGQDIIENASPNVLLHKQETADVNTKIEIEDIDGGEYKVAARSIIQYSWKETSALDELADLLATALTQQEQIDYLKEVVAELKMQIEKPVSERSQFKIKQLLNNISTFLGLVSLAATQVERAKNLLETIRNLLKN